VKNKIKKAKIEEIQKPIPEEKIRGGALPGAKKEQVKDSRHTGGGCVDPKCACS